MKNLFKLPLLLALAVFLLMGCSNKKENVIPQKGNETVKKTPFYLKDGKYPGIVFPLDIYGREKVEYSSEILNADLNGDGTDNKISAQLSDSSLIIEVDGSKVEIEYCSPNKILIADIDSDRNKEVLYYDNGPSDDYCIVIFKFVNNNLLMITDQFGIPASDLKIYPNGIFEGNANRGRSLCTWYYDKKYVIIDNTLFISDEKLIKPKAGSQIDNITVLKTVRTYKGYNNYEEASSLNAGEKVKFILTDDDRWWQVEKQDGTKAWINLDEIGKFPVEYFDGLPMAD